LRKQLEDAHPDLLRAMVKEMAEALMSADADSVCGAAYGVRSPGRVNRRNGYGERDWDTRVGSIELAVLQRARGASASRISPIASFLAGLEALPYTPPGWQAREAHQTPLQKRKRSPPAQAPPSAVIAPRIASRFRLDTFCRLGFGSRCADE